MLRPTLGHPNNKTELNKLCVLETARQNEAVEMINDYERLMTEYEKSTMKDFMSELQGLTELLLSQFDAAVTVDDVIEGGTHNISAVCSVFHFML